jgi:WD40 repeat protein
VPIRFAKPVRGLAFLPDGTLVIAGVDRIARIWDPASGQPQGPPMPHDAEVNAVAVSLDGEVIATGSEDRTARIWDARTCRPLGRPLPHQGTVGCVAFRPDGRALLTASMDHSARQWDLATGAPLGATLHHGWIRAMAGYSPDGRLIALVGRDAQFWDAATGKPVGPALGHPPYGGGLVFHPGGGLLFTSGWDYAVRAWDVPTAVPGDVGRLLLWTQVLTGMELGPDDSARDLDDEAWHRSRERLDQMGGPPSSS